MKLLIADDEKNIRFLMRGALLRLDLGFEDILAAEDGVQALELAKSHKPEIVITDIVMPGMGGHELAFEVEKINPGCVFIFISGHDDSAYLHDAIDLQVFRYILKPIDIDKLVSAIKLAAEESRKRRQRNFDYLFSGIHDLILQNASLANIREAHLAVLTRNAAPLSQNIHTAVNKSAEVVLALVEKKQILLNTNAFALFSSSGIFRSSSMEDLASRCEDMYKKLASLEEDTQGYANRKILEKAAAFVAKNYSRMIGAADIAEHCGISPGYLSKIFNERLRVSIPDYIADIRLKTALELLFNRDLSIAEVASRCGFSSANYFTKVFRAKYGEKPSNMRVRGGGR